MFRATYTFGKNIDHGGDFTNTASGVENPQEVGNPTSELTSRVDDLKGWSLFDTPHALSISYSYALPFAGTATGWKGLLLRDWEVSGTTLFQSGTPFHFPHGFGCARLRQCGRRTAGPAQPSRPFDPGHQRRQPGHRSLRRRCRFLSAGQSRRSSSLLAVQIFRYKHRTRRARESWIKSFPQGTGPTTGTFPSERQCASRAGGKRCCGSAPLS